MLSLQKRFEKYTFIIDIFIAMIFNFRLYFIVIFIYLFGDLFIYLILTKSAPHICGYDLESVRQMSTNQMAAWVQVLVERAATREKRSGENGTMVG